MWYLFDWFIYCKAWRTTNWRKKCILDLRSCPIYWIPFHNCFHMCINITQSLDFDFSISFYVQNRGSTSLSSIFLEANVSKCHVSWTLCTETCHLRHTDFKLSMTTYLLLACEPVNIVRSFEQTPFNDQKWFSNKIATLHGVRSNSICNLARQVYFPGLQPL